MHKAHKMIVINLKVHMNYTRLVLFGYSSEATHQDQIEVLFYEKKI